MAFMMPVVKNDWDIYKSQRPRRSSDKECPGSSSLSTSPGSDVFSPTHRSSRASLQSPGRKAGAASTAPPPSGSQSSLHKFHARLVDKLKRSFRASEQSTRSSS